MKTALTINEIENNLIRQLSSFWEVSDEDKMLIKVKMEGVFSRLEYCFERTPNKYYSHGGDTFFNPLQSAQYTIFLYYFSNTLIKETDNRSLADKLYYLNKIMNGCDLYHEVELPKFFTLDHPVGSVMGRAVYGEGFRFSQDCTVGNNRGIYPVLEDNVRLCAGASVIGNCHIGSNVTLGAGALVKDEDIPPHSLVFGATPNLIIKRIK